MDERWGRDVGLMLVWTGTCVSGAYFCKRRFVGLCVYIPGRRNILNAHS